MFKIGQLFTFHNLDHKALGFVRIFIEPGMVPDVEAPTNNYF
jgi:hypothetical protein